MDDYRAYTITTMFQNLNNEDNTQKETYKELQNAFIKFIKEYSIDNNVLKYRDQLIENRDVGLYRLELALEDLLSFNRTLAETLRKEPRVALPLLEAAIVDFFLEREKTEEGEDELEARKRIPDFQILVGTGEIPRSLRELNSETVSQLVVVSGIIISASKSSIKMKTCHLQCKSCGQERDIDVPNGFGSLKLPRICEASKMQKGGQKCPIDSYMIIPEKSKFIDVQTLKIQEVPELIPVGEIPRSYVLYAERTLVNTVSPGMRVTVVGIQCVDERGNNENSDNPIYIRVVQFMKDSSKTGRQTFHFSQAEEVEFKNFAKSSRIYEKITRSIAPAIFGCEDIKKAIACLLFGGCRKRMSGGVNLRGDINILLLGDPSTAKSQFLKFVERAAPVAVYTSGKGSSAAGLTASILRDPSTGEFHLEGGAMVLADGGVVCIDEFDKMRSNDRVAIHEAMEQQTISVAKAGITTTLNSRVSVLAAANPVYGHLDDLKTMQEQIDFQTTILSRFDCIFVVRDVYDRDRDKDMAEHIVAISAGREQGEKKGEVSIEFLKKYIAYAKSKCTPKLNEESAELLENYYVEDRQKSIENRNKKGNEIPVTVRQLEAIIRISESIAKMSLNSTVNKNHVEEAHRLFTISTLNAASSKLSLQPISTEEDRKEVLKVEEAIRRRLSIGQSAQYARLIEELGNRFASARIISNAILGMQRQGELKFSNERNIVTRKK